MKEREIIYKIVNLAEELECGDVHKDKLLEGINLTEQCRGLYVYKGYLVAHFFNKLGNLPPVKLPSNFIFNKNFQQCIAILKGNILSSHEVGNLFTKILSIPDKENELRELLLGSFYAALWPFMNKPENLDIAVNYGIWNRDNRICF